ncbi:type II toxin-antitoxin system death-on-curing family toxin [Sphaerisporangium corydalis]|uniref:Type II toxin-antitoxin system death-on-curing family toxin n=1 Tax=Sphaerisporangium corydalis TaxID=1441875 RepID=A0ABV9EPA9_9ACTN|nr:Fic family protein [Sphaerisporangium corydalis]
MTRYLTAEQVIDLAGITIDGPAELRDAGLLDSAVHRPQASMFGHEAYPHVMTKAGALLHSLAVHHPFARGDRQVAWVATVVFLEVNGVLLDAGDDAVHDLVSAAASGGFAEVDEIARILWGFVAPS